MKTKTIFFSNLIIYKTIFITLLFAVPEILNGSLDCVKMKKEPKFTIGKSNRVYIDTTNVIREWEISGGTNNWISHGISADDSVFSYTFWFWRGVNDSLQHGKEYYYRVRDITNACTSNTVSSIQDSKAPDLNTFFVPQKQNSLWANKKNVTINFTMSDSAGVWKIFLYERIPNSADKNWGSPIDSIIIDTTLSEFGYITNATVVDSAFFLSLDDGKYEFKIEGKDGTHTANSHEGNYVLAGNENIPGPDDSAHVKINIDTIPPDGSLSFIKDSTGQSGDNIILKWRPADDGDGIGCWKYVIQRSDGNGEVQLDSTLLNCQDTTFVDSFFNTNVADTFHYELTAFDSLGNSHSIVDTVEYDPRPTARIIKEPKYTKGNANEICWRKANFVQYSVVQIDTTHDFSSPDSMRVFPPATCTTFVSLENHRKYYYRVRHVDIFDRPSPWSDTTFSTQDATKPEIDTLIVEKSKLINGKLWVFKRDIEIKVEARDPVPGEIWNYQVTENATPGPVFPCEDSLFSCPSAASEVDKVIIRYRLSSAENTELTLSVRVFDGAGNETEDFIPYPVILDLVPADTTETELKAFPNPYNPMSDDMMIIRFRSKNETEVRIYDFFGNLVRVLSKEKGNKVGDYDFLWDGKNGRSEIVANGVYICMGAKTKARFKIGVKKQTF